MDELVQRVNVISDLPSAMSRLERHAVLIGKAILILGSPDEIPQMRDRVSVNADLVTHICPRV